MIRRVGKSKVTFALLLIIFTILTVCLIWEKTYVKGDTNSTYHTVVWIDSERLNLTSTADNKDAVLSENNITLYPEDKVDIELILDPVSDFGAGQKIIIKRAPKYFVSADGKTAEIRTWDPKVSEIIKKSAVPIGLKDQLSHELNSEITPGTTIVITRINEADIDIFEEIPFETVRKGDRGVPFGQDKVVQAGINGRIKKTYRVTYKNGIEISRRLISRETVTVRKDKIIASGIIVGKCLYAEYSGMVTAFYKSGYMGKYLLVTNLANGKQVKVKVIGFGPITGPILDLGKEAFRLIGGSTGEGHIDSVSVQLVD